MITARRAICWPLEFARLIQRLIFHPKAEMIMFKRSVMLLMATMSVAMATNKPVPPPATQASAHQSQGQRQVAEGGEAKQSQANTNTVTTAGGQGGSSNQSQSANNQGNQFSTNTVYEDRLQAPAISAPAVYASGPCAYGWSAGLSIPGGGLSGGKSKPDTNCDRRELARVMMPLNPSLAIRILCSDPLVASAGIKPEDCVYQQAEAEVVTHPVDMSSYVTREELRTRDERIVRQSQSK